MTSIVQLFRIANRFFSRDCRRGELLVLIFSMVIAMASVSSIYLVVDRIESAMTSEVSDVLGADLILSSPEEIDPSIITRANALGLDMARSIEFGSVLFANEKIQLSTIKAVSANYPLKGQFEIAVSPYGQSSHVKGNPNKGTLWVEPRIYNVLGLEQRSKSVEVGYTNLDVSGVIVRGPQQGSSLFTVAPTAIINIDDLAATEIIQPGSKVTFHYLFVGNTSSIKTLIKEFEKIKTTSQRISSIYDESPLAGSALNRSKKYIALSTLLTLILLGVTIAISANRYVTKQFDLSALMRCFGLTSTQVVIVFSFVLSLVSLVGVFIGSFVGYVFQDILLDILATGLLSDEALSTIPEPNIEVLVLPLIAAITLLFGFSLPAMLRLKQVSPMRVLRKQLKPTPMKGWLVYLVSLVTLIAVMWLQMGDFKMIGRVVGGLVAVMALFTIIALALLSMMRRLVISKNAAIKFSVRQLEANKSVTILHLLSFSITLFVITLIFLVRTELIGKWQQSLGEDTPNHFLINVKPEEVEPLSQFFEKEGISFTGLYPMVRGRITGINGESIQTAVSEIARQHNSLRRELNISWAKILPLGNRILEGDWQSDENVNHDDYPGITLESKTVDILGLSIGDIINFTIGGEEFNAKLVGKRFIDWQTFRPNFYVITKPGALDKYDATYITSFKMSKDQKGLLVNIVKEHPAVSVIELDRILEEIQAIMAKLTKAVEMIMIFVVAAGIALLWATMEHTFDFKYKQSAILRTLGAEKSFIATGFRFEYVWIALLSSLMAVMTVELVTYLLYKELFQVAYDIHWNLWFWVPLITLVVMMLASWRGVNRVTNPSPLSLIRG